MKLSNKIKVYLIGSVISIITLSLLFISGKFTPVIENNISALNTKIDIQEKTVVNKYNIYIKSELERKLSNAELKELYGQKKVVLWLAAGFQ